MVERQTLGWLDVERRNEGALAGEEEKQRKEEQEGEAERKKEGEDGTLVVEEERTLVAGEEETRVAGAEVKLGPVDAADGPKGAERQAGLGRNSDQQLVMWTPRNSTARTELTVIVPFLHCRCILMKLAVIHIPTDICGADWDCDDYGYVPPPPIPAIVEMERAFSASMKAEANSSVCEWLRGIT